MPTKAKQQPTDDPEDGIGPLDREWNSPAWDEVAAANHLIDDFVARRSLPSTRPGDRPKQLPLTLAELDRIEKQKKQQAEFLRTRSTAAYLRLP